MPGFIKPQLATLKTKAPAGEDCYRIQLHLDCDTRQAFTRSGHDWIRRFSVIAGAFDLSHQAIIDGEVVVVHEGRTNFSALQAELAGGRQDRLQYTPLISFGWMVRTFGRLRSLRERSC